VWDDKESFTKWRTGGDFKEAHGGGTLFGFVALLASAAFTLEGIAKPAFYEGILPLSVPQSDSKLEVEGGWRSVKADGVNLIKPDCFVTMNRLKIVKGQEAAFEQRYLPLRLCHPSEGQVRPSATLADWAKNAGVMEYQ
jgi:hypothetical protein